MRLSTRTALVVGFGGLILLLIASGLDAVQVLSQMQRSNEQIRREFLERARLLDHIRSQVYLSGTYVRDYLLEPDARAAERNRESLSGTRSRIDGDLTAFGRLARSEQAAPFQSLRAEIDRYWESLDPALGWDAGRRRGEGYQFLRDVVFPRRQNMLTIADRIAAVNEQELTAGDRRLSERFVSLRWRLIGVLTVTVMIGLGLAWVSMQRITRAQGQLRELSARLVQAQENERKSISRELHDAVGQSLSAVLFEMRNLAAVLPADPPALRWHASTVRGLVENAVSMVRNMALLLRPSMLDDLGLSAALEWQARDVSKRTGLVVDVTAEDLPDDLPDEHKTCIFRIVQEGLNNAVRHAGAQWVKITVARSGGGVELEIRDNGRGFAAGVKTSGLGLIGIRERAENLNGFLKVDAEAGRGTTLVVWLPLVVAG